jgi:hypothetical protein
MNARRVNNRLVAEREPSAVSSARSAIDEYLLKQLAWQYIKLHHVLLTGFWHPLKQTAMTRFLSSVGYVLNHMPARQHLAEL